MTHIQKFLAAATLGVGFVTLSTPAVAIPVYCSGISTTRNYMRVDDSQVASCLLSGYGSGQAGNIGQAAHNDPFLNNAAGAGYTNISLSFNLQFTQSGNTGTWSFNSTAWSQYSNLSIGFKFGTGGQPDEWFVFNLQDLVSSGNWAFVNIGRRGGGLSHLVLYASEPTNSVPEPGSLALLGLGLAGLAASRRRSRR